jgi:hypothetical protein
MREATRSAASRLVVRDDRFAVDHARPHWQGTNCGSYQRKPISEIIAGTRYQLHAIATAVRENAKAIVLDLVNPAGTGWRLLRRSGQTGLIAGKGSLGTNAAPQLTHY